ncbi:NAD(P)/FAD-dependent oxidoreductase [Streptomyces sp. NPDC050388]|uniref:FAD-dependent protein n=1 Tax=Streptomyces sp. NPDC050388 TaxID=3155781 RepID=UPI00343DD39C
MRRIDDPFGFGGPTTLDGPYDVVVVGAGPAGLFAGHRAAALGGRVLVVEAGHGMYASLCPRVRAAASGRPIRDLEKFRMQCKRCTCLVGVGGAAFHFDTNLGYINGLTRSKIERASDGTTRSYSGLERALGDFDRARDLVASVYEQFYAWGLTRTSPAQAPEPAPADPAAQSAHHRTASAVFQHSDAAPSQEITVDESLVVVGALLEELRSLGGELLMGTRVTAVERDDRGMFTITAGEHRLTSRNVVIGAGKLGLDWVRGVIGTLGVGHLSPRKVDLGVRIESWRDDLAPLTEACHNPKHSFLNDRGDSVRTFCVCPGGRLMAYDFAGGLALDGQHCITTPTTRSNFGVVTNVTVPDGVDGTDFALEFSRAAMKTGEGRPVVQHVGDFLGEPLSGPPVPCSLLETTETDLRALLGPELSSDVEGMITRLNRLSPGMVGAHAVIAAPVVERVYPDLELTHDLESTVPGLFFVGDSSSKIIGVTYGAVTGRVAAEAAMSR